MRADREAYSLIAQKANGTLWQPPFDYSIDPDPRSRLAEPSDPHRPVLPYPGPALYTYRLPEMGQKSPPAEPVPAKPEGAQPHAAPQMLPPPEGAPQPWQDSAPVPESTLPPTNGQSFKPESLSATSGQSGASTVPVNYQQPWQEPQPLPLLGPAETNLGNTVDSSQALEPVQAHFGGVAVQDDPNGIQQGEVDRETPPAEPQQPGTAENQGTIPIQPIPAEYWNQIPESCFRRIIEFESVREEYRRTFGQDYDAAEGRDIERLDLPEIVEVGRLNSRDYQTQKEQLYETALALSLERFDYDLKFSSTGNSSDPTYTHTNTGTTVNRLSVPSSLQVDKALATGGNFLARFANDVVLTFNGPQGFATDISSELLFQVTQSILQRDVLLNPLIQSERNLVYATRNFARFRKEFFFDLASEYYGLLSTYRTIEINAQNYFSVIRNFERGKSEVRSQVSTAPNQVFLNQFEQRVLTGLSGLIVSCNGLERELDNLKIRMGLPTEMPINIDLGELEELTLRDRIEVTAQRVSRWDTRVRNLRRQASVDPGELLNGNVYLAERLSEWLDLRAQLGEDVPDPSKLMRLQVLFQMNASRLNVKDLRNQLKATLDVMPPAPRILVLQRRLSLVGGLMELVQKQLDLAKVTQVDPAEREMIRDEFSRIETRLDQLQEDLDAVLGGAGDDELTRIVSVSATLLSDLENLSTAADRLLGGAPDSSPEASLALSDELLEISTNYFEQARRGLTPVDISMDDAMLTALTQRLDLMNERGILADDWRRIKIAADDLKSVLNLNATQFIGTENNRPFDFSWDNSQTRVSLQFDAPLNRKAQRNAYRRAMIDYQQGRRSLMQLEDNIKLAIRNELRGLELARIQYPISVASAALSAEQVISTQLQLNLGVAAVRPTDLLDALADSREALTDVANARIAYVVQRARFALDLELMLLDESDFWPEITNDRYQPSPDFMAPACGDGYGELPRWLRVSRELRNMQYFPQMAPASPVTDNTSPMTP